ncbi:MAG TPA: hypothetical protein VF789_28080 [Thermoanaerobaculia bacterium]
MKAPHLLRVEDGPQRFAPLIEAARAEGLRVGWLDLGAPTAPVPEPLESAAGLGVLRAVSVGEGRTVAVKPVQGVPVLKDLLREHFRGCAVVLVRGGVEAPLLTALEGGWSVAPLNLAAQRYDSAALVSALRSPHSWAPPRPKPAPPPEEPERPRKGRGRPRRGRVRPRKGEKRPRKGKTAPPEG